ncbi:hypothetical protein RUND412_009687 [Rhizina undulata]
MVPDPRRRRSSKSGLILPIALTVTAVVVGGIYLLLADRGPSHGMIDSEVPSSADATDTEHDPGKKKRGRSRLGSEEVIPKDTGSSRTSEDGLETEEGGGGNHRHSGTASRSRMGSRRGTRDIACDKISEEGTDDLEEAARIPESAVDGRGAAEENFQNEAAFVAGQQKSEVLEERVLNDGQTRYIPIVKKKSVAMVVAERKPALENSTEDDDYEHIDDNALPACLLTNLHRPLDLSQTTLTIFLYAPQGIRPSSPTSDASLEQIAPKPMSSPPSPRTPHPSNSSFASMPRPSTWTIASALLQDGGDQAGSIQPYVADSELFPLISATSPQVLYIDEPLAGANGGEVAKLLESGWIGTAVVVINSLGMLHGSDDEDTDGEQTEGEQRELNRRENAQPKKWWQPGGHVKDKFGNRLQVVEGWKLGDDWSRRVEEHPE